MSGKTQEKELPWELVRTSTSFFIGVPTDFNSSGKFRIPEPDQKITDLEDQLVRGAKSNDLALKDLRLGDELDEVLDKDDWRTDLPRRPGYGTRGEPIKLWTNYFHIDLAKAVFYRYAIKVKEVSSEKDIVTSTVEGESSTAATARGSMQSSSLNQDSKAKRRMDLQTSNLVVSSSF